MFALRLSFCYLPSGSFSLTQSIQSRRLINSALQQSSYLQSPVALRSDQKAQGIQLSTDRILIASSREWIIHPNHITYIYIYSTKSTFTGQHIITFHTNHKSSPNSVLAPTNRIKNNSQFCNSPVSYLAGVKIWGPHESGDPPSPFSLVKQGPPSWK